MTKIKYHITNEMEIKECKAQDGNCPYARNRHFDNYQDAHDYFTAHHFMSVSKKMSNRESLEIHPWLAYSSQAERLGAWDAIKEDPERTKTAAYINEMMNLIDNPMQHKFLSVDQNDIDQKLSENAENLRRHGLGSCLFSGTHVSDADMSGGDLRDVSVCDGSMILSSFSGSRLCRFSAKNAELSFSNFNNVYSLEAPFFIKSRMVGVSMKEASLDNLHLQDVDMSSSYVSGTIKGFLFTDTKMNQAVFAPFASDGGMKNVEFDGTDFRGSITNTVISGASMKNCQMTHHAMDHSSLLNTQMKNINGDDCTWNNTKIKGLTLKDSTMTNFSMLNSRVENSTIDGVDFSATKEGRVTVMRGVAFKNTKFDNIKMKGVDLSLASFEDCEWGDGVDLSGAIGLDKTKGIPKHLLDKFS